MMLMHFWQRWPLSLRWAIAISLGLHLFVIFPVAFWLYTPVAMPQAPLSAVLKGAGDVSHATTSDDRRYVPVSAGSVTKAPPKVRDKTPVVKESAQPIAVAKSQPQAVVGTLQGDASAKANAVSKSGTVGGAPEAARDGIEADALQRYRLALGVEARKARRYPEVSRTRGQEGACVVVVVLSKNGGPAAVVQGRSSGSATLDEGAFLMVRIAAERTPVPQELQGRDLRIPLQIRFNLDDF